MKPLRLMAGFAALAPMVIATTAHGGFDVNPVVSVIELPEERKGITLTVRNSRNVEVPVIFEIFERTVFEDGNEERTPADDLFLIFPPQAVVAPGETQNIRVQWVGPEPAQSRSFTLYASEVPVERKEEESGVRTIFRMGASVHVTSSHARPEPVLAGHETSEDGVRVTLANKGTRFFYIDDVSLKFASSEIGGIDLANVAGRTLVPPGGRRTFAIPEVSGTPVLAEK
ncbi:MAG: molecular chaperone [Alphaproteobacteria bacterium]